MKTSLFHYPKLIGNISLPIALLSLAFLFSSNQIFADYYSRYNPYPTYDYRRTPTISIELNPKMRLNSAFRIAIREGRLANAKEFLRKGANINSSSETKKTALMYASRNCSYEIARFLIRHQASVNLQDDSGKTALMLAIQESCLPVVSLLLKVPTLRLEVKDRSGMSAKDYALIGESLDVDGPSSQIASLIKHHLKSSIGSNHKMISKMTR